MKNRCFCKILTFVLILITVIGLASPAFAAVYNNTAMDGDVYTLRIGDTLELYNPDSSSGMSFSDYYWGVDSDRSADPDAVKVTDRNRNGVIEAVKAGTAVVYCELTGSYPQVNYGKRYNSAKKEWESYTYTTYYFRTYRRYMTVKVESVDPPKVSSLPDTVTVAEGKKTSITVKASTNTGTSLKYTWYYANKGSSRYTKSSITSKTYSSEMTKARDGRKLYCVVTDGNGRSTRSETVTLKLAAPVKIKTQPKTVTVAAGSTAKTSVSATGTGTLKYQWYIKNKNSSKFTKSSKTSKTYSVKMTPSVNGRQIYCVVSDAYGQKTKTQTVTLKMSTKLGIYSQPTGDKAVIGDKVSAVVKANGKGTLKYTWYYKNAGAGKYTKSTIKSATYSVKMTSKVNGRKVYCVVTDSTGSKVTSNTVTFKSVSPLKITKQPEGTTVRSGDAAAASVKVSGGSGVKYQWYKKDAGAKSFSKSSIAKSTYSITMKDARDGRQIYCVITDGCGQKVVTDTVTLNMAAPITITKQPADVWQVAGNTATVSVSAEGEGTLNYQWYQKDAGGSSFTEAPGGNAAAYSFEMTEAADDRQMYCVITDGYGQSVTSKTVTLINGPQIVITAQPQDTPYDEVFKVTYSNENKYWFTKQWFARKPGGRYIGLTTSAGPGTSDALGLYSEDDIDDPKNYIGGDVYCVISVNHNGKTQTVKSETAKILP